MTVAFFIFYQTGMLGRMACLVSSVYAKPVPDSLPRRGYRRKRVGRLAEVAQWGMLRRVSSLQEGKDARELST